MRCTKALVYKKNIINNLNVVKSVLNKNTKICLAVKADGYGCGAVETAKIAENMGVEYFAVATVDEGIELRENGINAKIILLSLCTYEEFFELLEYKITPLVFDSDFINELNTVVNQYMVKDFGVFLAVDTGMGRIGCLKDEAKNLALQIKNSSLHLDGMITHFAVSDMISPENIEYTKNQFKDFKEAIESVKSEGLNPGICTCSSSAASLAFPEFQLDMVRPGIVAYGYFPDQVTKEYLKSKNIEAELKPVLQFETQIVSIRHFVPGQSVSYGRTWICQKETDIAVLPVGYADGLLRRYSKDLKININGKPYPICGRICMDQCMVDIGLNNPDVKRWDKAIIFGPKENGAIFDASDVASQNGTISYEVLTCISKRVKREFIE